MLDSVSARPLVVSLGLLGSLALAAPLPAEAQQAEEPVAYVTYLQCTASGGARADSIVRNLMPVYDAQVAAGRMQAYGWLQHNTGGHWSRAFYAAAPTLDGLMDLMASLPTEIEKARPGAIRAVFDACPTHDDYIWRYVTGSAPGPQIAQQRAQAAISTYWECDLRSQAEADELMKKELGPIYDRYVSRGELRSWTWFSHEVGGKYRRLATMDGASFKGLMATWNRIIEDMQSEKPGAFARIGEICTSHQDYLWTVAIAKP